MGMIFKQPMTPGMPAQRNDGCSGQGEYHKKAGLPAVAAVSFGAFASPLPDFFAHAVQIERRKKQQAFAAGGVQLKQRVIRSEP